MIAPVRALRVYVQVDGGPARVEGSVEVVGASEPWTAEDLRGCLEEIRFEAAEVLLWHHMCDEHGWSRDQVEAQTYEGLVENHRQLTCTSHDREVTTP